MGGRRVLPGLGVERPDGLQGGEDGLADGGALGQDELVGEAIAASRSADGAATRLGCLTNATTPTLKRVGRSPMNFLAAALAASNRLGETSRAIMDSDTSTATMMVARSRGTLTDVAGRANPTIISVIMARNRTAATCRRQPGRLGATWDSSARLVKRTAYRCRRSCMSR